MNEQQNGILVFGGTFDPPHLAHAKLPPMVAERLGLGRILYVPAALNPLKRDTPPTAAEHRLNMLRLAVRDVPNAEISTLELERGGPSYTVETLEALRDQQGESVPMRLLIGADQALEFHRWKDWKRIVELAEPIVMIRPPWTREKLRAELEQVHSPNEAEAWVRRTIEVPELKISSTLIRDHLRNCGTLSEMLNPDVIRYIQEHGLYRNEHGPSTA